MIRAGRAFGASQNALKVVPGEDNMAGQDRVECTAGRVYALQLRDEVVPYGLDGVVRHRKPIELQSGGVGLQADIGEVQRNVRRGEDVAFDRDRPKRITAVAHRIVLVADLDPGIVDAVARNGGLGVLLGQDQGSLARCIGWHIIALEPMVAGDDMTPHPP